MTPASKQRDYLFDNYKVLLIVLVVVGHFIDLNYKNNTFLYILKWLIVSFHMPAFIFISGYFSKKELPLAVLIRKLAVPYIAYEIIYYLFYMLILGKETKLYLLYPKFSLWYLLALFVFRVITPYVKKLPHHMWLAVGAGLLIGCSGMPDNLLSLPRILVFYPYFLAGTYFRRDMLNRVLGMRFRIPAAACVVTFTGYLALGTGYRSLSPKIFYGRYNYDYLGQTPLEGILCRLVCYAVGFAMTFAVMLLVSRQKTFYSYIGTRTMAIYLFHGLTYSWLKECTYILERVDTGAQTCLLLASGAALAGLFSIPQLTAFTNKLAGLHLPDLRGHLQNSPWSVVYFGQFGVR